MSDMRLILGNRNYSSWSLRPWLFMRNAGVTFRDSVIELDTPEFKTKVAQASPTSRVPVLHDGDFVVWDSLAICEYINDKFPQANGWPSEIKQRALARAASAEMHSGFTALRTRCPMNIRRCHDPIQLSDAAKMDIAKDVERVQALWAQLRVHAEKGDFLLGEFGIVDAFFAPVVTRLLSYGVEVDGKSRSYMDAVMALPAMQEWVSAAHAEKAQIKAYETLYP